MELEDFNEAENDATSPDLTRTSAARIIHVLRASDARLDNAARRAANATTQCKCQCVGHRAEPMLRRVGQSALVMQSPTQGHAGKTAVKTRATAALMRYASGFESVPKPNAEHVIPR